MNQINLFDTPIPQGVTVKAWCKCGQECDCVIRTFSNGTKHAWGTCPKCGLTNAKQQRLGGNLDDLHHRLLGVKALILGIKATVDRDEAVAMLERLAEELERTEA